MTLKKLGLYPERYALLAGGFILLFFIWWIAGRPAANLISAHDFLDSIFLYYVVRGRHHDFFGDFSYTLPEFSGLPLNALALRDLGIGENLYLFLSPFWAYGINYAMAIITAFVGFYLLGRDYILANKKNLIALATLIIFAFIYALLPHKPQRLLGASMIPLLYWAGANLWYGKKVFVSWLIWLAYPFFAFLHFNGFAVSLGLGAFTALITLLRKPQALRFISLTLSFGLIYALIEIRSLLIVLWPDYKFESIRSARLENISETPISIQHIFSDFINQVFITNGHHHLANYMDDFGVLLWLVVLASVSAIIGLNYYRDKKFDLKKMPTSLKLSGVFLVLHFIIGLISFLDTHLNIFENLLNIPLPLRRIDTLSLPLLLIACVSLLLTLQPLLKGKWQLILPAAGILLLAGTAADSLTIRYQLLKDLGLQKTGADQKFDLYHSLSNRYTIDDYFLTNDFHNAKRALDEKIGPQSTYRTISIGFSPTKAQFNGFNTIDGYFYNYPMALYNSQYWPVVEPEFKAHSDDPDNFLPQVSARMYATPSRTAAPDYTSHHDWCAFTKNQGRIIFSARPITNANAISLDFIGVFGPVHVYEAKQEKVCRRA